MFCRFCGKPIHDDSEFCPYCGKEQTPQQISSYKLKKTPKFNIDIFTLKTIASVVFYVGIVVFLILLFKMAPGVGQETTLSYIVIAVIIIILSVVVDKIRNKKFTKKRQMIALFFGLLLLIPSVTLRIVYEAKVDGVKSNIPSSGPVCVQIKINEEFYSYYRSDSVREPYSFITIDGNTYNSTTEFFIDIGKEYTVKIGAGYEGRVGVASSSDSGKVTGTIILSPDNLRNGYTLTKKVNLSTCYAEVTVEFVRVYPFWEVIFATQ